MNIVKKLLWYVITGSASLILAACYGVPVDYMFSYVNRNINTKNDNGAPIPGLEVKLQTAQGDIFTQATDQNGDTVFNVPVNGNTTQVEGFIQVSDIDGKQNLGLFESQQVTLQNDKLEYNIVLKKAGITKIQ